MNDDPPSTSFLTKEWIDDIVNNSTYKEELKSYLSNHFEGLDRPASVSFGIQQNNSQLAYVVLKAYGLDVAYEGTEEVLDINKIVIDSSGIKLPFMNSKDALQATANVYDILRNNGIDFVGFALPQTKETLAVPTVHSGKVIDIVNEIDDNYWKDEILKEKSANDFILERIEESKNLPEIDVMAVSANNAAQGMPKLYRGGTLGNKPYSVVTSVRNKDCAYASPWMNVAQGYACGLGARYETVGNVHYGFIYEYEKSPQQKMYGDFGIENGADTVMEAAAYETPIFAHKNKLSGVYFATNKSGVKKVVKITDENGNFISKEWEDFTKLHDARTRIGNVFDKSRLLQQKVNLDWGNVSVLRKGCVPKSLDISECDNISLKGADFSYLEELKLPKKITGLEDVKLPKSLKQLDLSECDNISLKNIDLSNIEDLRLPKSIVCEQCNFRSDILCSNVEIVGFVNDYNTDILKHFPNLKQLDLSRCNNISLKDIKLPNIESLKPPSYINTLDRIFLPESLKQLDLSNCTNLILGGVDLSNIEDLKLPSHIITLEGVKLPKKLDLSQCYNINLENADLSNVEHLKLSPNVKNLDGIKLSENLKTLDLSLCSDIDLKDINLSNIEDLKLPTNIKSLESTKLPTSLKQLDLSQCNDINLKGADLSNIEDLKLPANIKSLESTKLPTSLKQLDLSQCKDINLIGSDLSNIEDLKLPTNIKSLENIKLSENLRRLDLSKCYDIDLHGLDLSNIEDLKLPVNIQSLASTKLPSSLKELDLSQCYYIDLENADLSYVENLKLSPNLKNLNGIKLSENIKTLDLSLCDGIDLKDIDLSNIEDLKLPSSITSLENTKLPKSLKQLDLSGNTESYSNINLKNTDLSHIEELKLPKRGQLNLEGAKLPNMKELDLSQNSRVNLIGADLSNIEDLKLPKNIETLEGIKLPKKLDLSECWNINLEGADLSNIEYLKLPQEVRNADLSNVKDCDFSSPMFDNVKLPNSLKSLDLTKYKLSMMTSVDFNQVEELKLPEYFIKTDKTSAEKQLMEKFNGDQFAFQKAMENSSIAIISPDCKLDNVKKLDASLCKDLDLRNWDLTKIEELKLPKNFDVSKLPEGILEKNPAVAKAVKEAHGEIVETITTSNIIDEPVAKTAKESLKDTMEREAVKAGTSMGKVIEGAVSGIAKADNAVNQAIDTVIDKGSEALNNTSVGKAYEQVADAVSNTKVVKAVEKATAEAGEKVAKTAVGKSVTKVVAKTAGSAVGRSVLKKIPVLSIGAGLYYAYDRIKDGDWKGACGEVASGALGCFPGLGTAASAAIDVGLAAKDISAAVNESKTTEATSEEKTTKETPNKNDIKNIIMQKRGLAETKAQTRVQSSPQQVNLQIQQRLSERGRG